MIRYATEKDKAHQIVNLTSLTVDQFEQLIAPFEQAFVKYMREWTMEGKPRLARSYTPYRNSPLPTPEDRLLFVLSYLKSASLQVVHASVFEMTQSNANKWIHILLVVLAHTLHALGDAPARHITTLRDTLAQLYGAEQAESEHANPLFITMGVSDQSRAPKTVMNRKRVIAVRKSATT